MKVTTDSCLFGAWVANEVITREPACRKARSEVRRILDIGAGSGLLSLILAQKVIASIDAIEIDKDAFEQAKENINPSPWADRINIFHTDARDFPLSTQYDVIISNPPFYENELLSPDSKKNMAHHEGLALDELLKIIKKNLVPGGMFYLLLPYKRNAEIEKLVTTNHMYIIKKTLVKQSVNHDHFRIMIAGEHANGEKETIIDEIAIRNENDEYTNEFITLLKDYYLHL